MSTSKYKAQGLRRFRNNKWARNRTPHLPPFPLTLLKMLQLLVRASLGVMCGGGFRSVGGATLCYAEQSQRRELLCGFGSQTESCTKRPKSLGSKIHPARLLAGTARTRRPLLARRLSLLQSSESASSGLKQAFENLHIFVRRALARFLAAI